MDDFASNEFRLSRLNALTYGIDITKDQGIEVGALNNPTISTQHGNIKYVDYATTEALRAHPHASSIVKENIVEVDYVWAGTGSLAKEIGNRDFLDFAIASHVIEHVPNIAGWFQGIFDVLRSGGLFNLAIPDRRFTFDMGRKDSTIGEVVEAYLLGFSHPSIRQEFDHCYGALAIEPGNVWKQRINAENLEKYSGDVALQLAYDQAKEILRTSKYFDAHCWVFTPSSFISIVCNLTKLGIFPFVVEQIMPTAVGQFEFFVHLIPVAQNVDSCGVPNCRLT